MTDSVAADGQTPMTGDLDLNNNKIVNLAPAAFAGEAVEFSQLQAATSVVTITGGTINGATIGATTPASGRFTTLEATSTLTIGGISTFTGNGSFNGTGALKVPAGTTGQQPTPVTGQIRFNSTDNRFEGYNTSAWVGLGTSAGGSNTQVQYNSSGALVGSSSFTFDGTVLTVPKITFVSSNTPSLTNYQGGALTNGTSVASTSGTSIDFTSIPSWVKRITVMLNGVSTNSTSNMQIQIGDSGGIENTGYAATAFGAANTGNLVTAASSTSGFPITSVGTGNNIISGSLIISLQTGTTWVVNGSFSQTGGGSGGFASGGTKTLSDVLDRVRITTINGTDSFDAGSINILYE
jgi:hypothetical protein